MNRIGITFTGNLTFDSIEWLKIEAKNWHQFRAFEDGTKEYKNFKTKFDAKYHLNKRGLYYTKYVRLIATAQALDLITKI